MSTATVGTAGRALGSQQTLVRELPPPPTSDYSSFCLICATWHFGQRAATCRKCDAPIFRWVLTDDLRHFHMRTSRSYS